MKLKFTLSLLFASSVALVNAQQPTLTAATSIPVAGLEETYNQNTNYSPGNAGTNQTWDFSAQTYPTVSNMSYEVCNSSNNCSAFPGTTIVGNSGTGYVYYTGSSSALSITGVSSGGSGFPYSNPEDDFHFPFTYGDSYVDTWATTITSGISFYRTGIDSVLADGWGTLITPAGTFSNTLRVKRISTFQDSANISGVPFLIYYKTTLYTWNDVSHKDILYSTSSLVTNNQGSESTSNSSTYVNVESAPIAIKDVNGPGSLNVHISPNPALDNVWVSLNLPSTTDLSITLTDVAGHVVYHLSSDKLQPGINRINISTANFSKGIYIFRIIAGGLTNSSKLVIQ